MKLQILVFVCLMTLSLQAQDQFSYISDKPFSDPSQLIGYTFVPNAIYYPNKEFPNLSKEVPISAGEVSFAISPNYLYVKGEEIGGAYSISSINSVSYGFKMDLMNARNPTMQGHLKIILNKNNEVDALVFKQAARTKEIVYYQAEMPQELEKQEAEHFTDGNEVAITDSTLWGTTLYPMWGNSDQQMRIRMEDKVTIQFVQDSVERKKKMEAVEHIEVTYLEDGEFGGKTPQTVTFPIIKIVEKVSQYEQAVDSRYIIEFSVKNLPSKKIIMILNQKRQVQRVIIGETTYLMRGVY